MKVKYKCCYYHEKRLQCAAFNHLVRRRSRPHCWSWGAPQMWAALLVSAPWKRDQGLVPSTLSSPVFLSLTGLEALRGNVFGLFWKRTPGASH